MAEFVCRVMASRYRRAVYVRGVWPEPRSGLAAPDAVVHAGNPGPVETRSVANGR
jgi:hypothetical protein